MKSSTSTTTISSKTITSEITSKTNPTSVTNDQPEETGRLRDKLDGAKSPGLFGTLKELLSALREFNERARNSQGEVEEVVRTGEEKLGPLLLDTLSYLVRSNRNERGNRQRPLGKVGLGA